MNFVDLIELVVAWEQWVQGEYFEEDAANAPNIHFVAIVTICHEALWGTIPARRNVLRQRWLAVKSATTAQVCQLYCIAR